MSTIRADELRAAFGSLRGLLKESPELEARYRNAKQLIRVFRRPAFYEVSTRCNLWCEGCYFFEGGHGTGAEENRNPGDWEAFFAAEAARGVSIAYFVGAEPALEQERLFAAAPHFPYALVGTNGTMRIDPAIPFRIGMSVWAGDDQTDARLRGGSVFRKGLRNYAGDPRAFVIYTVSHWNIEQSRTVVQMCADHGVAMTFSGYSPTQSFLNKLSAGVANDGEYFRVSSTADSPILSDADLSRLHQVAAELIDEFPQTVLYSHAYNDWISTPGPRYDIDPATGIARNCGSRVVDPMRHYSANMTRTAVKCCTPDIDCSQCRIFSGGWSTRLEPGAADMADRAAFERWLDMMDTVQRIFLYPAQEHRVDLCAGAPGKQPQLASVE